MGQVPQRTWGLASDLAEDQHISIYDVPLIGKWTGRVGHVIDIVSMPCAGADWKIGVLAAWYNIPHLLIGLTKPDSLDLISQRWGGKHGGKRKKRFSPLEFIKTEEVPPRGVGWAWFTIKESAEKIGWYMLVADLTTEFAVNWTSTAYAMAGCKTPGAPFCQMEVEPGDYGPGDAGTYIFSGWNVTGEHIFAGDGNSIATAVGYNTAASVSFVTKPLIGPFAECSVTNIELIDLVHDTILWSAAPRDGYFGQRYASGNTRDWGLDPDP